MEGSRWILVKVVFFQLRGRGLPQGDATPNFFPDSKSIVIGLSNEASFVSRYYCKIPENWEKEEAIIWPYVSKRGKLYIRSLWKSIFRRKSSCITKLFNFENSVILALIRLNLKVNNLNIFEIFDDAGETWLSGLSNDMSIIFEFWALSEIYLIFL